MKHKSELKIGLTGVLTIIVIIWGINYLKGRNIFSSSYELFSMYSEVDGLEASAGIIMNGFKIGTVADITFDTGKEIPFFVTLEIDKNYNIPKGSTAEIYSADLLGSKSLRILPSANPLAFQPGDTLPGSVSKDMITMLMSEIKPLTQGIGKAVQTLDSTGEALNTILRDPAIKQLIANLENSTSSLNQQLAESGDLSQALASLKNLSAAIEKQSESIQTSILNFEKISEQVKNAELDSLIKKLSLTGANLASISENINSGEGSLGKMIYEDSLYTQMLLLVSDLDSLINDINEHPKKYVSISLFGK